MALREKDRNFHFDTEQSNGDSFFGTEAVLDCQTIIYYVGTEDIKHARIKVAIVLLKKAEKFETKELQKITVKREHLPTLAKLLNDAYVIRRPKPNEYHHRKELVRVFNEIAKEIYGNCVDCPVVEEFGSFSMDLFTTGSDLDMSINFSNSSCVYPRAQKIKTLRKFARKFYALQNGGHVCGVQPIMSAKVPIIKIVDTGTGVECDLSVENRDGIVKSHIIHLISSIDERFHKLCFLMKIWAKAHDINSSKDRTLNSLSIILLVAFHLQTRHPPILPPLSAILKDGEDLATVKKSVKNFENYGRRNTESLGELFISFLIKLASVEKLWPKGLCASPYQGHWVSKTWDTKIANMSVEDFTDRTQNVARAVGKAEVEEIYKCIQHSIKSLNFFMNGQIEVSKLNESLFGKVNFEPKPNINHATITNPMIHNTMPQILRPAHPVMAVDHRSTKRMRVVEGFLPTRTLAPGPGQGPERGPELGPGPGWRGTDGAVGWSQGWGGSRTGSWGAPSMQSNDSWGSHLQQPPIGTSFFSHGQGFR